MSEQEARQYYEQYGTRRFTTHYEFRKSFFRWSGDIRKCVGIENNKDFVSLKDIDRFGGFVVDLSHYVDTCGRQMQDFTLRAVRQFPVIVNHASLVRRRNGWSWRFGRHPSEYRYLSQIPGQLLADVVSLETAKDYF